jgi:hypothetical protein
MSSRTILSTIFRIGDTMLMITVRTNTTKRDARSRSCRDRCWEFGSRRSPTKRHKKNERSTANTDTSHRSALPVILLKSKTRRMIGSKKMMPSSTSLPTNASRSHLIGPSPSYPCYTGVEALVHLERPTKRSSRLEGESPTRLDTRSTWEVLTKGWIPYQAETVESRYPDIDAGARNEIHDF